MKEEIIKNILTELQIPKSFLGFKYITTAVLCVIDMETFSVMELYKRVAKKHKTTASKVEKDIRYALEFCNAQEYFNVTYKVISKEFIELIKDKTLKKLSMEQEILSNDNELYTF